MQERAVVQRTAKTYAILPGDSLWSMPGNPVLIVWVCLCHSNAAQEYYQEKYLLLRHINIIIAYFFLVFKHQKLIMDFVFHFRHQIKR